jgi:hypothetical protein
MLVVDSIYLLAFVDDVRDDDNGRREKTGRSGSWIANNRR